MYTYEQNIRESVEVAGGKLYRVGGCVRDEITHTHSKDVDYLITGLELCEIKLIIQEYGKTTEVGKSFGIVTARIGNFDYDFSIPRVEISTGSGHLDFDVKLNKNISLCEDLSRRDFTMCAIAKDVATGEYVDPFNGIEDLKMGRIRAVRDPKERFSEDPLRMLRAIQFANRFGFKIDDETLNAIKENVDLIDNITGERILEEFKKAFTKGKYDSNTNFVDLLDQTGLGKHIFGFDFKPVKTQKVFGDKFIVNMILLFVNGGRMEVLKPPTEVINAVNLASKLRLSSGDALKVMFKNGRYLSFMIDAAKSMNDSQMLAKLNSLNGVPLENKDIQLDSQWLMDRGYVGKALGDLQKALVLAIYTHRVKNDTKELEEYVLAL